MEDEIAPRSSSHYNARLCATVTPARPLSQIDGRVATANEVCGSLQDLASTPGSHDARRSKWPQIMVVDCDASGLLSGR